MTEAAPAHLNLLLVDDSPLQSALVSSMASQLGFRVTVAATEAAALAALASQTFHLLLVELHPDSGNGFSVGQRLLRLQPRPCLLLTGLLKDTDDEWAKGLGLSGVVERPDSFAALLTLLIRHLPARLQYREAG